MTYLFPDDAIDAPNEDIPAAIPSLIDAAAVPFDADRDTSRCYLMRALALLRVGCEACADAEGEVKASHVSLVSHPDMITGLILEAAQR